MDSVDKHFLFVFLSPSSSRRRFVSFFSATHFLRWRSIFFFLSLQRLNDEMQSLETFSLFELAKRPVGKKDAQKIPPINDGI